eukprot:CAMPEP_0175835608 /NCGR_PEP_ID=MMETSP0107_2-20121207/16686_1 /TAXON_ID=195067 ORGANISM="Goniomonas pacifica, Strain CCMP1869" /NCGR_SAMPLE_ID=MMETSP0107_2 /ASSEMBLY_ACC=CAM_ASM_000203 /LENGTH=93 /DNA_ID=CAMNT_0017148919 /DNA_START=32 /DNA_END=314 /DNA_ORIENTATION=+
MTTLEVHHDQACSLLVRGRGVCCHQQTAERGGGGRPTLRWYASRVDYDIDGTQESSELDDCRQADGCHTHPRWEREEGVQYKLVPGVEVGPGG